MAENFVDPEVELLAMMVNNYNSCDFSILKQHHFRSPRNRILYAVIDDMYKENRPVNLLTLLSEVSERKLEAEVGGSNYVSSACVRVANPRFFEEYARIVINTWTKEQFESLLQSSLGDMSRGKKVLSEVIQQHEEGIYSLLSSASSSDATNMEETVLSVHKSILQPRTGRVRHSGFDILDVKIGGMRPGELIIVAGRPGMGKTAFALTQAWNMSLAGTKSLFFSIDMGRDQFYHRLYSLITRIDTNRFGDLQEWSKEEQEAIKKAPEQILHSGLTIETSPYISIADIRKSVRIMKDRKGISCVFIDHIGKIAPHKATASREREIGAIVEALKGLSKEFDVTVVALSQLNRAVELREDKRPTMSDLRDSVSIEQEADIILFPYRPEYYGNNTDMYGRTTSNIIELVIAKNRNSRTDTLRLGFQGNFTTVFELQQSDFHPTVPPPSINFHE
jgi:replicative DNA helicase